MFFVRVVGSVQVTLDQVTLHCAGWVQYTQRRVCVCVCVHACSLAAAFPAGDRCRWLQHGSELLSPGGAFDGTHITDSDRRERQFGAMFHFDVDVRRKAHVVGRDGVHVVDESNDCCDANNRPPTFLYRSYSTVSSVIAAAVYVVSAITLSLDYNCDSTTIRL